MNSIHSDFSEDMTSDRHSSICGLSKKSTSATKVVQSFEISVSTVVSESNVRTDYVVLRDTNNPFGVHTFKFADRKITGLCIKDDWLYFSFIMGAFIPVFAAFSMHGFITKEFIAMIPSTIFFLILVINTIAVFMYFNVFQNKTCNSSKDYNELANSINVDYHINDASDAGAAQSDTFGVNPVARTLCDAEVSSLSDSQVCSSISKAV